MSKVVVVSVAILVSGLVACVGDGTELAERGGADVAAGAGVAPAEVTDDPAAPPGWVPLMPGSQCTEHGNCDSEQGAGDGFCYRGDMGGSLVFPDAGYCTIDDGSGAVCATDADCPGTSRCASADGYRLCLPACGAGNSCPSGQACLSSFGGLPLNMSVCLPGNGNAHDGDACTGFYDCNGDSTCWNDIENPGGNCSSYNCTVGSNAGCHGGFCINFDEGPSTGTVCVDSCFTGLDCRGAAGYVCYDPDGLGAAAPYCRHPHVGDPCLFASSCGGAAAGWSCKTGIGWSGGYCTQTACPTPGQTTGCGAGAVCATVSGTNMCVDRCPTIGSTNTCRSSYTCKAVGAQQGGGCLAP